MRNLKLIYEKRFKNNTNAQRFNIPNTEQFCVVEKNGQFTFQTIDSLNQEPPPDFDEATLKVFKTIALN